MGEVVEVGSENKALKVGDRVVVPFTISCGECFFCKRGLYSGCERSNPNAKAAESCGATHPRGCSVIRICSAAIPAVRRSTCASLRGCRPDQGPDGLSDDQVLFLSDIFPTGYMAAEFCDIKGGETVAIWGCGPVGQFAIKARLCSVPGA